MSARENYDTEQVVRRTEVRDQGPAMAQVEEVVVAGNGTTRPVDVPATQIVVNGNAGRPVAQAMVSSEVVSVDRVVGRRAELDRVSQVIWFIAVLLEAALGFRIVFKLLSANADNGFVHFINGVTEPFVKPFNGIFTDPTSGKAVLDSGALLAMFVYLVLAWALVRLIWVLFDRNETGSRRAVHQESTNLS